MVFEKSKNENRIMGDLLPVEPSSCDCQRYSDIDGLQMKMDALEKTVQRYASRKIIRRQKNRSQ